MSKKQTEPWKRIPGLWKTKPLCVKVHQAIRSAKIIDFDTLHEVAEDNSERIKVTRAMLHLIHDHPYKWQDKTMTGSYLKRLARVA